MKRLSLIHQKINQSFDFTKIFISIEQNIGFISLKSPKDLNCLSDEMLYNISEGLKQHDKNPSVKVIMIRSLVPKLFCAGANIKDLAVKEYQYFEKTDNLQLVVKTLRMIKKPVIAVVNGKALGGGFQLALLCDIILCTQNSYFSLPEINLGLSPGMGGTQRLPRLIGQKKAMKVILTGSGFSGKKAIQLNIAERVSQQNLQAQVKQFGSKISSKASFIEIIVKKTVKQASNTTLEQGLTYERDLSLSLTSTSAFKEGVSAFFQKRKPDFSKY